MQGKYQIIYQRSVKKKPLFNNGQTIKTNHIDKFFNTTDKLRIEVIHYIQYCINQNLEI